MKTTVLVLTIIGACFSLVMGISTGVFIQGVGELNRNVGNLKEASDAQSFGGMLVLAGLAQFVIGGFGGMQAYRKFGSRDSLKWGVIPLVLAGLLSITNTCSFFTSGLLFFVTALLTFLGTRSSTPHPVAADPSPSASAVESALNAVGSRIKSAGQLAAAQARRTKMATLTLPGFYKALGRHLYSTKSYREDFPTLYAEFERLAQQLKAIKAQAESRPDADGMAAKTKAVAAGLKDSAQTKALDFQVNQAFSKLGAAAFDKFGEKSGPFELVQPISEGRSQLAALDQEITNLAKAEPGQLFTPKRIAIAGVCIIALIGLAILGNMVGNHGGSRPAQVDSGTANSAAIDSDQSENAPSNTELLTKKQFIAKMRRTKTRGIINNSFVQAIFENGSFQKAFGDPDSNIQWTNGDNLITYRCSDGSIQLTVTYLPGTNIVSVTGMNQF